MFTEIPLTRPSTPLLDLIENPAQLRTLDQEALEQLSTELREYLLYCVGKTGGHFGAGLGVEIIERRSFQAGRSVPGVSRHSVSVRPRPAK